MASIFQIAFFFRVDEIIVASGGHDRNAHTGLHPGLEIDILVQVHVRPEIHKLYLLIPAADAVDAPEALDDAHGVPVDVIVDKVVAVLEVLTFRDAIRSDQDVDVRRSGGAEKIPVFGYRREAGQNIVERPLESLDRRAPINRARDNSGVQSVFLFDKSTDMVV